MRKAFARILSLQDYSTNDQNEKETNLPTGQKPIFFILKKSLEKLPDNELIVLKSKVLEKIVNP